MNLWTILRRRLAGLCAVVVLAVAIILVTPDPAYAACAQKTHYGFHTAQYTFGQYFQHYGYHNYTVGATYPCNMHTHIRHYH